MEGHPCETIVCPHFLRRAQVCWRRAGEEDQRRQRRNQCGGRLAHYDHEAGRRSGDQLRVRVEDRRPRCKLSVDHALERDMKAPDRTGGVVRVEGSSRWLRRPQDRIGVRRPDHVARADPALIRFTWSTRWISRRPDTCIAPRRMTCCNAHLS